MSDWANSVDAKIKASIHEREESLKLQLHRAQVMASKGEEFFSNLKRIAESGVREIKESNPQFGDVCFEPPFVVRNPVYPAIGVEVTLAGDGIIFKYTRVRDARAAAEHQMRKITFDVEQQDNLVLDLDGRGLATIDDVLHVIVDPIFRL